MKYKKEILKMMKEDYRKFCNALFSIEFSVTDEKILNNFYDNFMENNDICLLDQRIIKK